VSAADDLLALAMWGDDRTAPALLDAYRAEVLAETAPPCAVCETPIEWVACPTGGWWAHHTHPDDGHDALPPGAPTRAEVLREAADWLTAEYTGPGLDAPIRRAAARLRAHADTTHPGGQS
jgi:hypothetical protein